MQHPRTAEARATLRRCAAVRCWLRAVAAALGIAAAGLAPCDGAHAGSGPRSPSVEPPRTTPAAGARAAATADDGHLWLVLPADAGTGGDTGRARSHGTARGAVRLLHHHPGMAGGTRIAGRFERAPLALAARGNRLWIALPRDDGGGNAAPGGDVTLWTLRAVENPALRTWFNDPADRFELLPALPSGVVPEAMTATDSALLVSVRSAPELPGIVRGSDVLRPERRVLREAAEGWSALPALPASAQRTGTVALAVAGVEDDELGRLVMALDDGTRTRFWFFGPIANGSGRWRDVGDVPGSVRSLLTFDGRPVAIVQRPDGAWHAWWLRDAGPLAGAVIEPRPEIMALVGDEGGAIAIELDAEGQPALRPLDLREGTWGESLPTIATPSAQQRFAHVPLLGLLAGAAVLTLLLLHPERIPATLPLPAGFALPEFAPRCGALVIDFALGAAIAWAVTRVPLIDLLFLPIWTAPIEQAAGPLLALFLTAMIAGLFEAATGASLGKRAIGLQMCTPEGAKPGAGRALLRALLKFVVLCLPLLAIFHILNPVRRGLPELLTGTWILRRDGTTPNEPPRGERE